MWWKYLHQASLETICPLKTFQLHHCPNNNAKNRVKHFPSKIFRLTNLLLTFLLSSLPSFLVACMHSIIRYVGWSVCQSVPVCFSWRLQVVVHYCSPYIYTFLISFWNNFFHHKVTKQVTRGHNIVADVWAGASNPHPRLNPPPTLKLHKAL